MIEISASVKDHLLDSLLKALSGDEFSDLLRSLYISCVFYRSPEFGAQGGGTHQRFSSCILNRLNIDMLQTSKDIKARPFSRSPMKTDDRPEALSISTTRMMRAYPLPPLPPVRQAAPAIFSAAQDTSLSVVSHEMHSSVMETP